MAQNNGEKVFEYFLQVPENVRMRMFDEMIPKDRCRMTRCSKLCNIEAKSSKNYIHSLDFTYVTESRLYLSVQFAERIGYELIYTYNRETDKSCITYRNLWHRTLYTVELESTENVIHCCVEKFIRLLQEYQQTIKSLSIFFMSSRDIEMWRSLEFDVVDLRSLKELKVLGPVDVQQFLQAIHHPLNCLSVGGEGNIAISENYEQKSGNSNGYSETRHSMFQVSHLFWPQAELDNAQFLQLEAIAMHISVAKLTERDIFKFIRSWQDGTIGKAIKFYEWGVQPNFSRPKLLKLLRVADRESMIVEVKHFIEVGKSAKLRLGETLLTFNI